MLKVRKCTTPASKSAKSGKMICRIRIGMMMTSIVSRPDFWSIMLCSNWSQETTRFAENKSREQNSSGVAYLFGVSTFFSNWMYCFSSSKVAIKIIDVINESGLIVFWRECELGVWIGHGRISRMITANKKRCKSILGLHFILLLIKVCIYI